MIRKFIIVLLVCFIISTVGIGITSSYGNLSKEVIVLDKVQIDNSKPVMIDFEDAKIEVKDWDRDYIQVRKSQKLEKISRGESDLFKIIKQDNGIKLEDFTKKQSVAYQVADWLTLAQFKKYRDNFDFNDNFDFIIYAPTGISLQIVGRKNLNRN